MGFFALDENSANAYVTHGQPPDHDALPARLDERGQARGQLMAV
tara:strand:+ start:1545 stop:1676 length:132 start_codon:yes stop_codon:yes gene_type:complete